MSYINLFDRFKKISSLNHLISIAYWDESTMMPEGGASSRAEALAQAQVMKHELLTSPEMGDWIEKAKSENLSDWQQSNVREIERVWKQAVSLPNDLVEKISLARSTCSHAWRSLRQNNDWKGFSRLFAPLLELVKVEAQALGEGLHLSPYDALINVYEPGQSQDKIQTIFAGLKKGLPDIIQRAIDKSKGAKRPKGPFPLEAQKALGQLAMKHLGFDFQHGRLDVSHHPFCGGVPKDVRITTRYTTENFLDSLFGVVHETGHARYEQNLPEAWLTQPVGAARGMGVHEGQSLLFENMIGHSPEFLSFLAPHLKHYFSATDPNFDWSADGLIPIINSVQRSLIRTSADEVTYPMHVILRFEIEQDLVSGKLNVADLPEVWDTKMQTYLGLSTKDNDKDGCMQDIHWSQGAFGYFPSYTLGAMTAAQLYSAALEALPRLPEQLKQGDTTAINQWLSEKVWSKGSFYTVDDLLITATGKSLGSEAFLNHLGARYS